MAKDLTKAQVVEILGVSARRVEQHYDGNDPIPHTGARFPCREFGEWFKRKQNSDAARLTAERARLAANQADKVELEVGQLRGDLIAVSAVKQIWAKQVLGMRALLLAMPTKLASVAMSAGSLNEVREFCQAEVEHALDELSGGIGETASSDRLVAEFAGDDEETAEVNSVAVGGDEQDSEFRGKRRAGQVAQ